MSAPLAPWWLVAFFTAGSIVPAAQDAPPQFRSAVHGLRLEVELTTVHDTDLSTGISRLGTAAFSVQIGNVRPTVVSTDLAKYEAKNVRFRCPDGSCLGFHFQRLAVYLLAVDATDVPRDGRSRDIKVTVTTRNTKVALKPKSVRILRD
jgi:hypothetical protein